ncbi:MAG: uroporphyrinogen-III synthase [Pseudotabrizicola sp.]|uniref:uroporphyrinogen-III synthase n=1 Tax=Pseudotabrizicola sp. TaxID=2939647 RepID=UPI0027269760|nr:uroporphyrinogen-III synthase [Pseudotabrizicola sp.]MDO8882806.1 uroporphyrinogen-III synthase [Pseudotabrizicola sp.]MDP2080507.1 uroporphyrinogen-III synthase [Pseudotabrizicola sp.]MDZ7575232.1 uroporphyrinogen-III synthase [Pseudotabrizicola sp.]
MAPQSRALPVLITRPEPQASRFAHALQNRYGDQAVPILSPLLSPVFLKPKIPDAPFGAVILTSETGARAAAGFPALPRRAYCVGDRTAEVARTAGFEAYSASGDADQLFRLLQGQADHAPFLHLRGREARGDLAARLTAANLPTKDAVVYAQEPVALSPEAIAILSAVDASGAGPVIVPLFSPRTAEVFRRALSDLPDGNNVFNRLRIAALSPAIAEVFVACPPQSLGIAEAPSLAELFLVLDRFIITA